MGAAAAEIPRALIDQLREGGRLLLPVGPSTAFHRYLQVDKLPGGEITVKDLGTVRFTPLIGTGDCCTEMVYAVLTRDIRSGHAAPRSVERGAN